MRCFESPAVLAVRVFLDQLLEGFEGLARIDGRALR